MIIVGSYVAVTRNYDGMNILIKNRLVAQMSPNIFSRVFGLPVIGPLQLWHWFPVLGLREIMWWWQSSQVMWPCTKIQ